MSEPKKSPPIDWKKHGPKVRDLMQSWRAFQGNRAADGVKAMMQSLEFIAEPIANQQAFAEQPIPVVLTRKQVRLAQKRAISQQRRAEFGPPEQQTPDAWWEQIQTIAARWKIPATKEEWSAKKQPKPELLP